MKRFKVMGLCLVAAFALSAVLVSSASAKLEYKTCIKALVKNTGNYSEKTCSDASKVAGTGKYERAEWNAGKKVTFKAKNIGSPHNNIVNPFGEKKGGPSEAAKIEGTTTCAKEKVAGEGTGPTSTTWKTEYKKCEALETKCNTLGQKEGTIITDQLVSVLVNLDATKTSPGILVKGLGPETPGLGKRLAQYECLNKGLNVEVFGAALAKVSGNLNSAAKATTITVEEGPLKLQSNLYLEGSKTEEQGKAHYEWTFALQACEKGEAPFPPGEKSQATCEGFIGPDPAPGLISLISKVSGAQNAVAPAVQNGVTTQKGESELIEDN